jgi:uncharacterized protein (TIGR00730 family)
MAREGNLMKTICIFCGSSKGTDPIYAQQAQALGEAVAQKGLSLVYGGGDVGLMSLLARSALAKGGEVTGVIPRLLHQKVPALKGIQEIITEDMHSRKAKMYELSDAFIALPGGIGTMEELMEVWTWTQLGYHRKPLGVLNIKDYFGPLLALADHMRDEGFLKGDHRELLLAESDPQALLETLEKKQTKISDKW